MGRRATAADEDLAPAGEGKEGAVGPSTLIQPLFEAGRLKAAAAALAKLEDDGAPSWETLLWRARIAEKEGRCEAARKAFFKALAARPESVNLELDIARFFEARGRLAEAEAHLRRALKLTGRIGEVRLALARLQRRLGRPDRAREQLRLAARAGSLAAASLPDRALLAADLIAAGRLAEAERVLLLSAGGAQRDPGAWLQGLLSLAGAGRFSPRLERAFRAAPEACARSWPRVFSALLCSRRYGQAFGLAEAMLRRLGPPESPWELLWPWFIGIPSAVGQGAFCAQELARVERAARRGGFPRWFAFCRAVLLDQLPRREEAWAQRAAVSRRPHRRYVWMEQSFVLTLIQLDRPREAAALARRILRVHPDHLWLRERLADASAAARKSGRRPSP
jgi:tetratricopeptide (TPR) repeat protein